MTAHDLDKLLNELDGKADTVTLFGEKWTLPTDVDADTMLRVQRLQTKLALARREGREIDPAYVVDDDVPIDRLVEVMAGPENYAAWRERGLKYKALLVVAGRLYAIHNGDNGTSPGKARKPTQDRQPPKRTGSGQRPQPRH